ncbi:hypothetical protein [Aquipuribacter sp. MA13-6]|uniref:hypothetical protein n=1 Tax=unclassified Aquipuribacter TaxID=2635084 RepID=UPI003EEFB5CA
MVATADEVIEAIAAGAWQTADLVRLAHAVASRGINTTSILGQYGEELVARAFGGHVEGFDTKAYDARTPSDGDLQVKTFSRGKRPGNIRSFTHDVITLEIDPATASVVRARRYAAAELYESFGRKHREKYETIGHPWGGAQTDRFERGWTIGRDVPFLDVTELFVR